MSLLKLKTSIELTIHVHPTDPTPRRHRVLRCAAVPDRIIAKQAVVALATPGPRALRLPSWICLATAS